MKSLSVLLLPVLMSSAWADQGTTVVQKEGINLGEVNFSGQLTSGIGFSMEMKVSCFGTNLRNVPNPLAPNSDVTAVITLRRVGGPQGDISIRFPASLAMGSGVAVQTPIPPANIRVNPAGFVPQVAAGYIGKTVVLAIAGVPNNNRRTFELVRINFQQTPAMPTNPSPTDPSPTEFSVGGAVNASYSHNMSSDGTMLYVKAAFPGASGSCGSYYSPLMIFFSDKRTSLTQMVDFKVRPNVTKSYWPEGSEEWALLAFDRNGNGSIDHGGELFGGDDKHPNGFELLKAFDSNKDGVVSAKDKDFGKLRLWFDRNGNAKTEKGELIGLKEKDVQEISLNYKLDGITPLGDRGEYREKSTVRTSKGQLEIIDVWFGTAGGAK